MKNTFEIQIIILIRGAAIYILLFLLTSNCYKNVLLTIRNTKVYKSVMFQIVIPVIFLTTKFNVPLCL